MSRARQFYGFVAEIELPISRQASVAAHVVRAVSVPHAETLARRVLAERYGVGISALHLIRQSPDGEALLRECTAELRKRVTAATP